MVTEQTKPVPSCTRWARRLQAIAQTGVAYPQTHIYDRERYAQVRAGRRRDVRGGRRGRAGRRTPRSRAGQATPKLDVRGVVFRGDTILLVREEGAWSLPGGWVDVGESPTEAAVREVLEESGYETRAVKLLALLDRDRHDYEPHAWHIWKAIVLCELLGEDQRPLVSETDAARFFTRDALPEPLRSGYATRALVERAFEHLEHPEWPADLD